MWNSDSELRVGDAVTLMPHETRGDRDLQAWRVRLLPRTVQELERMCGFDAGWPHRY